MLNCMLLLYSPYMYYIIIRHIYTTYCIIIQVLYNYKTCIIQFELLFTIYEYMNYVCYNCKYSFMIITYMIIMYYTNRVCSMQ